MQDEEYRIKKSIRLRPTLMKIGRLRNLALFVLFLVHPPAIPAQNLTDVVSGLQRRYATVQTIAGNFQQTYRAPGIEQVESGVFRMKKPCLMRWEYRAPEEKLFVADGRESFLFVPHDRQVTVAPFSVSDLRNTPLELLLGSESIYKSYTASWEATYKPKAEHTVLIRLMPRRNDGVYEFIVLELNRETYDLRRIILREFSGNTSEFLLWDMNTNTKMGSKDFKFKPPKGAEVVRLTNNE
jgi:outer membrane lipoprotein carrier protein